MIKVLQILSDSNIGGAGIVVKTIVENINDNFMIYIAVPKNAKIVDRIRKRDNIKILEIKGIKDTSFSQEGLQNLRKLIKEIEPDIIHTHASLSGRIAGKLYRKAYIINSRHCLETINDNPLKFWIKKTINNLFSDKIHAVSDGVYDNLIMSGAKKEKIIKINNSVDKIELLSSEEMDKIKAEMGINDKLVIGFLGRLEEVKNPLNMIDIARELIKHRSDFVFLVGGSGSLENTLIQSIKENNLEDNFILLSEITDLGKFYSLIDLLINTSISEAISLSILEAMTCKKAVLSYDVDKLSQIIKNGENGYLIENSNTSLYADKLLELFEKEKREALGENSFRIFNENFSLDNMISKIEELYINGKRRKDKK